MHEVYFLGGSRDGKLMTVPDLKEIYLVPVWSEPERRLGIAPKPPVIEEYRLIHGAYVFKDAQRRGWI